MSISGTSRATVQSTAIGRVIELTQRQVRPFQEVGTDEPLYRGSWWNPQPLVSLPRKSLNWVFIGIVGFIALILLLAKSPVGLLFALVAAGYIGVITWSNSTAGAREAEANAPVSATALDILFHQIDAAVPKAQNQMLVDLQITPDELEIAKRSSQFISRPLSVGEVLQFRNDSRLLPRRVQISSAAITESGVAFHTSTYDVVSGNFMQGDAEMMLWGRLARIYRSGNRVVFEANSGGSREIALDDARQEADVDFDAATGEYITRYVNPFLEAAQRSLQNN